MKRKIIPLILALAVLVTVGYKIASANSSTFVPSTYMTTSATTTRTQIFPGQATTTFAYDTFAGGIAQPADSAILLLQQTASTAPAVLNIRFEYSQDGVDWYGDSLDLEQSTTSTMIALSQDRQFIWQASSTSVQRKALTVKTPTRYVRVLFAASNATTSVWAQIVPKREVR